MIVWVKLHFKPLGLRCKMTVTPLGGSWGVICIISNSPLKLSVVGGWHHIGSRPWFGEDINNLIKEILKDLNFLNKI